MPDTRLRHRSFDTWNAEEESLESVERRIHDGVSTDLLHARAEGYARAIGHRFPNTRPAEHATVMEIGSGVAYIMEAFSRMYAPATIVGLDVAPGMIKRAKERIRRDGLDDSKMSFCLYDGITFPQNNNSFDLVYSVASLQHVPREYFFQIWAETMRVLKPEGRCYFHLLGVAQLKHDERTATTFLHENLRQLNATEGHWHHYYSAQELVTLARHVYDCHDIDVDQELGSVYLSCRKTGDRRFASERAEALDR